MAELSGGGKTRSSWHVLPWLSHSRALGGGVAGTPAPGLLLEVWSSRPPAPSVARAPLLLLSSWTCLKKLLPKKQQRNILFLGVWDKRPAKMLLPLICQERGNREMASCQPAYPARGSQPLCAHLALHSSAPWMCLDLVQMNLVVP